VLSDLKESSEFKVILELLVLSEFKESSEFRVILELLVLLDLFDLKGLLDQLLLVVFEKF
jgi:hypothetical protein